MGFFQNLGLAYGRNLIVGQDMESKQADIEYKQALTAQQKMSVMSQQNELNFMKNAADSGAMEREEGGSETKTAMAAASKYSELSRKAVSAGAFQSAERFEKLATQETTRAKNAETVQEKQRAEQQEFVATTALNYQDNPTPENAQAMERAAVEQGIVDPLKIPKRESPQYQQMVKQLTNAEGKSKDRLERIRKVTDAEEKAQAKKEAQRVDNEAKLARMREKARTQGGAGGKVPTVKEFDGIPYQWDPSGKIEGRRDRPDTGWVQAGGVKQTAKERSDTNAIIGSAGEALRGLRIAMKMPVTVSSGAFAGLRDDTVAATLQRVAGNKLTPESKQIYQTIAGGMGLEIGRVLTLGGGRGVNESQIKELQKIIQIQPNDTEGTAMFKVANAADIIRNRLSTLPHSMIPKVEEERQKMEAMLKKIPSPEDVLANLPPSSKKKVQSISSAFSKVPKGGGDSESSGLPKGWKITKE